MPRTQVWYELIHAAQRRSPVSIRPMQPRIFLTYVVHTSVAYGVMASLIAQATMNVNWSFQMKAKTRNVNWIWSISDLDYSDAHHLTARYNKRPTNIKQHDQSQSPGPIPVHKESSIGQYIMRLRPVDPGRFGCQCCIVLFSLCHHAAPSCSCISPGKPGYSLSLIHISEPTRRTPISYAVFCLKKKSMPSSA